MKFDSKTDKKFTPITIEITIESKSELDTVRTVFGSHSANSIMNTQLPIKENLPKGAPNVMYIFVHGIHDQLKKH